ncbi:hypothetical protein DSUL_170021 [Desulfovibrionales bacterium]
MDFVDQGASPGRTSGFSAITIMLGRIPNSRLNFTLDRLAFNYN